MKNKEKEKKSSENSKFQRREKLEWQILNFKKLDGISWSDNFLINMNEKFWSSTKHTPRQSIAKE